MRELGSMYSFNQVVILLLETPCVLFLFQKINRKIDKYQFEVIFLQFAKVYRPDFRCFTAFGTSTFLFKIIKWKSDLRGQF